MDAIEELIRRQMDGTSAQMAEAGFPADPDYEAIYEGTLILELGLSEDEAREYMVRVTGKKWGEIFLTFRENTGKRAS